MLKKSENKVENAEIPQCLSMPLLPNDSEVLSPGETRSVEEGEQI